MMATKYEIALRLDATLWLLGAGMGELPLPLYDKLIDYREDLKEALGPSWYPACSGKLERVYGDFRLFRDKAGHGVSARKTRRSAKRPRRSEGTSPRR